MPTIAYQSFNANSSSTHGLASISSQNFTRQTNAHATGQGHQALVLPHISGHLTSPVEGPAHLRPVESLSGPQTVTTFGAQVSLAFQNFYRSLGSMPDIMVVGELDTSHPDFTGMVGGTGVSTTAHPSKKACQSFTAISQNAVASGISFLDSGEGYVVYAVGALVVVFVHVPNRIATKSDQTAQFYLDIAGSLGGKAKYIDLIIGDTNQPSFNFSAQVLNQAFNTNAYVNASSQANVSRYDSWNVPAGGTNSVGTKVYDIAVYRSDINILRHSPVYISQSAGAVTVTDHCGLALSIERKSGT
ncbi:MAG TPA: hypothetical protein VGM87_09380 [Roseomonas sp.]